MPAHATLIRKDAPIAPAAGEEYSIVVQGLVREFAGGFRAVDGIDLVVYPGEIYGFLGPNGAGKSTTVHMLTTLLPPSGGAALVAGYDVARQAAKVGRASASRSRRRRSTRSSTRGSTCASSARCRGCRSTSGSSARPS